MADEFASYADTPSGPSDNPYAVTPSNADELTRIPKALYIGTGGTVIVRTADGVADITFKNVSSGQILPVRAKWVRATGTTAADIVALG